MFPLRNGFDEGLCTLMHFALLLNKKIVDKRSRCFCEINIYFTLCTAEFKKKLDGKSMFCKITLLLQKINYYA